MPLTLDITTSEGSRLGVWRIDETAAFFSSHMVLSEKEQSLVAKLHERNKRQWLASRYLLDKIVDHTERIETSTLPTGKPILLGREDHISLTHSEDCVAAMIGNSDVGIDIQRCKEKILHIEHKFANAHESACIDRANALMHLHILWCAKEVLYKIYSKKKLSFSTHLFVDLPKYVDNAGRFSGSVRTSQEIIECSLNYIILENYVLVYGQKKV